MSEAISIKGIREGLLITISDGAAWHDTAPTLFTRIDQSAEFFKGARLTLDIGPRALNAAELGRLRDTLSERNVNLWAVLSESPLTTSAAQALGLRVALPASAPTPAHSAQVEAEVDPEEAREEAVLVRRTLRSGRSVRHTSHVVVLGDVNPGAEIVAGGDIIVWGRLRGVAHAGADGDDGAVVCALDLSPTQLRIARYIATSPERKGNPQPEVARVRDGHIMAERWKVKEK
jgi:septum site-determining protein MinC